MSMPGMGVMIGMLGGNKKTVEAVRAALGKVIYKATLEDDTLMLAFEDGSRLAFTDEGQSCCERRWMHTDADLPYYTGAKLLDVSLEAAAPPPPDDADAYEAQFLHIHTDKGILDAVTHVDHNGYYGGFWVVARPA